jgi:hypothetical protein
MVAIQEGKMKDTDLLAAAGKQRKVGLEDPLVKAARAVGTRFGTE